MFFSKDIVFKSGIAVLFVLFFFIIFSHNGIVDYYHLSKDKQLLLHDNKNIEEKNSKFTREIIRLKNDKEYIEHVAKHEFGMASDDELVFRTIHPRKNDDNNGVSEP
jgi:cell division protein FtsB